MHHSSFWQMTHKQAQFFLVSIFFLAFTGCWGGGGSQSNPSFSTGGDLSQPETAAVAESGGVKTLIDDAVPGAISIFGADIDDDDKMDAVAISAENETISWWRNTAGDGTAWTEISVDDGFSSPTWVIAADIDGDGDLDVVSCSYFSEEVAWWKNTNGDGSAWTKTTVDNQFPGGTCVIAGDFDGDNHLDIAACSDLGIVQHWENTDDVGGSWEPTTIDLTFMGAVSICPAHVDDDGVLDIVGCAGILGQVAWWSGADWSKTTVDAEFPGNMVAVGDIDGDGNVDIAGVSPIFHEIAWWSNDEGDGSSWTKTVAAQAFGGATCVQIADMDGDTHKDLVGGASDDEDLKWFENTADDGSAWTAHTVDGNFPGAFAVFVADVNGDQSPDIFGATGAGNYIAWWTSGDSGGGGGDDNAPSFVGLDAEVNYTTGQPAIQLDTNASIIDMELDALNGGNGNYAGAVLTLSRDGGPDSDDVFSFPETTDNLSYSANNISLTGANIIATITNAGGQLQITFADNGTAPSNALANEVLNNILFANQNDEGQLQINYVFDDGTASAQNATGFVTVNVSASNDNPPAFSNLGGTVEYEQGGSPIFLDNDATLSDTELDAANGGLGNYNMGVLTLGRSNGASGMIPDSDDAFSFPATSANLTFSEFQITHTGTDIDIATFANEFGLLQITFEDTFGHIPTTALVNEVLQNIRFANDEDSGSIVINYEFDDATQSVQNATGSVTVNLAALNHAPTTTGAFESYNTYEDESNGFSVVLSQNFSDVEDGAANLIYSVMGNTNEALVSYELSGAELSVTIHENAFGTATLTIRATDSGGKWVESTQEVNIAPSNDAPSFTKGSNIVENEDFALTTIENWASNISKGPANESDQTLHFVLTNNNNGLFDEQPAISPEGTLTFDSAENANGMATVSVTLFDDGGSDNSGIDHSSTFEFTITITAVNDAPSFTMLGNQTALEDAGGQTVENWATEISKGPENESNQTLTFIIENDNEGLFSIQPSVDPMTGILTYTPAPDANGIAEITITLQDSGGTSNGGVDVDGPFEFDITIFPVNDAPSFTPGGNVNVFENSGAYNQAWATNISKGPENESGQTLSFQILSNDNEALFSAQPGISSSGVLTFTPAQDALGMANLSVKLMDNGGTENEGSDDTSETFNFTITVNHENSPPVLQTNNGGTTEEGAGMWITPELLHINDEESDDDEIVYTLTQIPAHGTLNLADIPNSNETLLEVGSTFTQADMTTDSQGRQIRYYHDGNENTADSFSFTVSDGTDSIGPFIFNITITPVNDAPELETNEGLTVAESQSASISNIFLNSTDVDSEAANNAFHYVTMPQHGKLYVDGVEQTLDEVEFLQSDITRGVLTYTHDGSETTTDSFSFRLHDDHAGQSIEFAGGGEGTVFTFTITITPVNDAPVGVNDFIRIRNPNATPAVASKTFNVLDNDTDPEGNTLSVQSFIPTLADYFQFNVETYEVTFLNTAPGGTAYTFTYILVDSGGALATATGEVVVGGLSSNLTDANPTITEGNAQAFHIALAQAPISDVTIDLSGGPFVFTPSTFTFTTGNYFIPQDFTISLPENFTNDTLEDSTPDIVAAFTTEDPAYQGSIVITASTAVDNDPFANAGENRARAPGQFTLDGTASKNTSGNTVLWELIESPNDVEVAITNPSAPKAFFQASLDGDYTFRLSITKSGQDPSTDAVTITVNDVPPVAVVAGGDTRNINLFTAQDTVNQVLLDASPSFDANGSSSLAFAWTLVSGPDGASIAELLDEDQNTQNPVFMPLVDEEPTPGRYVLRVTVSSTGSNQAVSSSSATTTINVIFLDENDLPNSFVPPSANAGAHQSVTIPKSQNSITVTLYGHDSVDPDSGASGISNPAVNGFDFLWSVLSKPAESAFAFSGQENQIKPQVLLDKPGDYIFGLVVTDNNDDNIESRQATVTIRVTQLVDRAPYFSSSDYIFLDGSYRSYPLISGLNSAISISATGFIDPENEPMTYVWTQTEGPNVDLEVDGNSASFTPITPDTYTFKVIAVDSADPLALSSPAVFHRLHALDTVFIRRTSSISADELFARANDANPLYIALPSSGPAQPIALSSEFFEGANIVGLITNKEFAYTWEQIEGPTVVITNPNSASASFTPSISRTYAFRLTLDYSYDFILNILGADSIATDSTATRLSTTLTSTVYIGVSNPNNPMARPVAQVSAKISPTKEKISIYVGNTVNPDNDDLTYFVQQQAGPDVEAVYNPETMSIDLSPNGPIDPETEEHVGYLEGNYRFAIRVDDGADLSPPIEVAFDVAVPGSTAVTGGESNSGGCFIATASLADGAGEQVSDNVASYYLSEERLADLNTLRNFRDSLLMKNAPGRAFVNFYYSYGPKAAQAIKESETAKFGVRLAIVSPLVAASKVMLWQSLNWRDLIGFAMLALYGLLLWKSIKAGFRRTRRLYEIYALKFTTQSAQR